jgi:hypothetical protein
MNRKPKSMLIAVSAIGLIWAIALGGYLIAQKAKMTADKVSEFGKTLDFSKLTGAERAAALRALEDRINRLPMEERQKWRQEGEWREWFNFLTENEKGQFIEATMPTGFKQMLNAFEDWPADRRKRALDSAIKRMKENPDLGSGRNPSQDATLYTTNAPVNISPELEKKAITIGLKTFYSESSAQTKVELAPLLEELQHQMESGRTFRQN